jgi:basic amino acid/polyamine antiporter, APA family
MKTLSQPAREITLFDSICLIVSIMVGTGIFESSPAVAQNTTGSSQLLLVWVIGGTLSLLGAFTYSALACKYPETGGDYVFLKRAFGPRMSFIYAWTMLTVVRPGNIGAMAYVFARYAQQVFPLGNRGMLIYACGSILLASGLNLLGTREGKGITNGLTVAKVLGLLLLVGVAWGSSHPPMPEVVTPLGPPSFTLALIYVLFAFGGWNEIAFVAAEVKNPQRNLFLALVGGTAAVTVLYLVVNLTFLHSVGFEGLQQNEAVAHTIASHGLNALGGVFVSTLIAVSALGTLHAMIFSGARIYYAMGQDHPLFSPLGTWSERGTPFWSIFTESAITLALMALFSQTPSGFESLILYTTPLFWVFMALVAVATFRLLKGETSRVAGYPFTPIAFLATCFFMLGMSMQYAYENGSKEILWSLLILAAGVVLERVESIRQKHRRLS